MDANQPKPQEGAPKTAERGFGRGGDKGERRPRGDKKGGKGGDRKK